MSDQHVFCTFVRRRDRNLSFDQNHATKSRTRKSQLATHDADSGPSLDFRTAFRFCTWNVLSMGEHGCDLIVVRELSRLHLCITALTEVRWPGSGTKTVANSIMLWSGRSDNKRTATSTPTKTNSTTPSHTSLLPLRDVISSSFSTTWTQPSDQTDAAMNPSSERTRPGVETTTVNGSFPLRPTPIEDHRLLVQATQHASLDLDIK